MAAVLYWTFAVAGRKRRASAAEGEVICCSFCGKSQDEVRKIIAGPKVYICDECIDLCNDIIAEECDQENARGAPGATGGTAGDRAPSPVPALVWLVSGLFLALLAALYLVRRSQ
jgi:hypothetical protein